MKHLNLIAVIWGIFILTLFSCSDKVEWETTCPPGVKELRIEKSYYVLTECTHFEINIKNGSGDYTIIPGKEGVVEFDAFPPENLPGMIYCKTKTKGETTLRIKDNKTGLTGSVDIQVTNAYFLFSIYTSATKSPTISVDHPDPDQKKIIEEKLKSYYHFSTKRQYLLVKNEKKTFYTFAENIDLGKGTVEATGTYEIDFTKERCSVTLQQKMIGLGNQDVICTVTFDEALTAKLNNLYNEAPKGVTARAIPLEMETFNMEENFTSQFIQDYPELVDCHIDYPVLYAAPIEPWVPVRLL
ncbi:MAG: hypothetical protein LUH22_15450 [Bacteroides sp.]|nr:hypothetical protein [Bacteroides sp.]